MIEVKFHQKALVFNSEGKFLVLKRNYTNQKWDLPGGAVELPEKHDDSLSREIKEETGLVAGNLKPLEIQTTPMDNNGYLLFIGYECSVDGVDVVLSHEHSEYRWVTKEEFLGMDATQYLKNFVKNTQY